MYVNTYSGAEIIVITVVKQIHKLQTGAYWTVFIVAYSEFNETFQMFCRFLTQKKRHDKSIEKDQER